MSKKESVSRGEEMEVVFQNCSGQIISLPFLHYVRVTGSEQTTAVYRKMGSNSLSFCFYTFSSHKCYTTTISDANCLTVTMYIICGKAGHANLRKNRGVQEPKC